jgi:phage portal protein BeeE/predicted double-glycine peptidase
MDSALDFLRKPVEKRATRGERILGSLFPSRGVGFPGGWSQDRLKSVQHFVNWTYVSIHAIACKTAQLMPNMAYVSSEPKPGHTEKYKWTRPDQFGGSNIIQMPSVLNTSGSYGFNPFIFPTVGGYYRKALSVIKPHEELEPVEQDHLLRRLIENPNPFDTAFDFFYEWAMFEELCGVAYIWKVPNKWGRTCELYVIPSHWVWPRTGGNEYVHPDNPHADELIQFYEVRPWGGFGSAGIIRFPPNEVIRSSWKSPINKLDGYSPSLATAQWIDVEESISKSRWSQMTYGAYPSLHVELPESYEDPNDDRIARIEAKFMQKYVGEYAYGRPIFTPSGSKLTPLGYSPNEMAYFQSEEQVRDMILSARGVPKAAVGVVTDMTYGAVLATLASWCSFGLCSRLTMHGQRLTKDLASEFSDGDRQIRIWYDDPTPADPAQLNADLQADWQMFSVSPNEVRAIRGRKPWKLGGDNPMGQGPGGMVPYPLNVEEQSSDMNALVEHLISQNEPQQQSGGTPAESGPTLVDSGPVENPDMNPGIDKPNGEPSKSLKKVVTKSLDSSTQLINLPDIRQQDSYSCGAAVTLSVSSYYGVGTTNLAELKKILGTTEKDATSPIAIVNYLNGLGLQATPKQNMTINDLEKCFAAQAPVICFIQEYGIPSKPASFNYGHVVAVIGVGFGQVFVQDPSSDNVINPKGEEPSGSDQTPGRSMISYQKWSDVWHDRDAAGTKYVRFGIIVGGPAKMMKGLVQKDQGTCGPGQRADLTGCTPEDHNAPKNALQQQESLSKKTKKLVDDFKIALDKTTDKPVLRQVKACLGAIGKVTKESFNKLETRYGRKQAIAIFAAGHVAGLATPLAIVPGSTLIGMVPFVAIAETYLQASKGMGKLMGKKSKSDDTFEQLTPDQIKLLGQEMVKVVSDALSKWMEENPNDNKDSGPKNHLKPKGAK